MNAKTVALYGALLAALVGSSALALAAEKKPAKPAEPVRKVSVETEPVDAATLSAMHGVTICATAAEATKTFGKNLGKQLGEKVDFAKNQLVHVGWGSSGPPFGELRYTVREDKEVKTVVFSVLEPNAPVRGQAYRMGTDFFAIPKHMKAEFAK